MVRISSGGSSMRSRATISKYGGRNSSQPSPSRPSNRPPIKGLPIRNTKSNNAIRQRKTLMRGPSRSISKKSKETYEKSKGKGTSYHVSNPSPYGRDKYGNALPKPKDNWGSNAGPKKVKKLKKEGGLVVSVAKKSKGTGGVVKGSGIKTLKFKSIKSRLVSKKTKKVASSTKKISKLTRPFPKPKSKGKSKSGSKLSTLSTRPNYKVKTKKGRTKRFPIGKPKKFTY